jgi:hypothetical protein
VNQLKRGVEGGFCVQKKDEKKKKERRFKVEFDTDSITKKSVVKKKLHYLSSSKKEPANKSAASAV